MAPKKHNRFNLSCILYSLSLVLILFVAIPAIQKWDAQRMMATWEDGYRAGLEAARLPTIEEIQEKIGCEKVDGIWGEETNRLYDKFLCNQFALACFEGEEN